jgi:hypothetical protein
LKRFLSILPLFLVPMAYSCPVGKTGLSKEDFKSLKNAGRHGKLERKVSSTSLKIDLPTAASDQPWGGKNPKLWRPEAILANAASLWLNTGWNLSEVAEVLVSVPVKMIPTNERVYGDGQTNASLGFGPNWNEDHPQLVATLVKYKSGDRRVILSFSPALKIATPKVKVTSFVTDTSGKSLRKDETLDIKKQDGQTLAGWIVPKEVRFGDLENSRVFWVRPDGWDSAFPVDFRVAVYSNQKLSEAAKGAKTAGLNPLDPMEVRTRSQKQNENPQTTLLNTTYGPQWVKNEQGRNELRNESIHGAIHPGGKEIKTAVGGGLTWLVDHGANSTFKNLYTCFDPRNFQKESRYGVPSGGGWHEIGDAAETIINDVESGPVTVGFATGLPWPTPPDSAKFAWGLSDVATMRLLVPGEGIVTSAGDQTWKEDEAFRQKGDSSQRGKESSGGGRNYHWFFFTGTEPTCTQEWVHNCRPTEANGLGLGCP